MSEQLRNLILGLILILIGVMILKSSFRKQKEGYWRTCPHCGSRIKAGYSRCPFCRRKVGNSFAGFLKDNRFYKIVIALCLILVGVFYIGSVFGIVDLY